MIIVSSTKISISKDISNNMGSNIIQQALLLISKTPSKEGAKGYYQYTLEELKSFTLWERIKINDWRLEFITLTFTIAFVFLFKLGDWYNVRLVSTYVKSLSESFSKNFFLYGVSQDQLYIKDSSVNFSSYASGRSNIAKVNISFKLQPRHNVFIWVMENLFAMFSETVEPTEDRVDFAITPSYEGDYDNFISAIVSKLGMNSYRRYNYFLSLTKTTDSDKLPESFVFMSEGHEFQEKTYTDKLANALNNEASSYIRYIAFTDQPIERPEKVRECEPHRRIFISTHFPSNKDQYESLNNILDAIFSLVDDLSSKKITFKPEALKKVVKTRENEISKLTKAEEELKQEKIAEEKAKLKKQERDRIRSLSKAEQLKLEKKELEKKQRKTQRKQKMRA
ncbi:Piso0_000544 [Millerozyma farinosa CBS 7064]|uniref:Piso0_000544 protein n=1 Tax=Pichia sorbitophila (strain ATCC MYA-4447 / BCRC 22081 / CBS 7064 / NBRC 10061 / NRRL Y-12695) TaxID=559304 RepID=G8YU98_PICSO|nr:Piso0_000544 [Millerozyma farinosa CBS 7064]CCE73499.1 Piso0_000544 [Millerozyma farinosa CBS 7064]